MTLTRKLMGAGLLLALLAGFGLTTMPAQAAGCACGPTCDCPAPCPCND